MTALYFLETNNEKLRLDDTYVSVWVNLEMKVFYSYQEMTSNQKQKGHELYTHLDIIPRSCLILTRVVNQQLHNSNIINILFVIDRIYIISKLKP